MSMNQDAENFESLRRLLALKRHEQPPPGYFGNFSSQVITRIKHGDSGERVSVLEQLLWESSWLQRLWASFEAKPVLAGVFGLAVCGLLITAVIGSEPPDIPSLGLIPPAEDGSRPVEIAATVSAADHPLLVKPAALELSSTNPVGVASGPFFGDFGRLRAEPAAFSIPGRN